MCSPNQRHPATDIAWWNAVRRWSSPTRHHILQLLLHWIEVCTRIYAYTRGRARACRADHLCAPSRNATQHCYQHCARLSARPQGPKANPFERIILLPSSLPPSLPPSLSISLSLSPPPHTPSRHVRARVPPSVRAPCGSRVCGVCVWSWRLQACPVADA